MGKKLNKVIVAVCILIAGCSIDYNEKSGEVKKSDEIPDSILVDFNIIKIKDNTPHTEVKSTKAEIYNNKNRTIMHNIEFLEFDKDKSVITKGTAKRIEYFNDTENASLSGDISFYSEKEGIKLTGETLNWNNEEKEISSDGIIKVIEDDGSQIEGKGFRANIKKSTFSFKKDIKGIHQ